jgi:type III secretion protein T
MNLVDALAAQQPHVIAVALVATRLVPIAFLCPLLGGQQAPVHVKLGVVLALALFLHFAAGAAPSEALSALHFFGLAVKEVLLGVTLGLLASLPFDAARMGGRFIDLFRGSSAEAALPLVGSKEAATGDALHHLLVGLAATGAVMPLVVEALVRSYRWAPLGVFAHTDDVASYVVTLVGGAFATALALGAPLAAMALAVDSLLGLASRAAPGMNLHDTGAPLRILGGGAVLWLAIGHFAARLEAGALAVPETLRVAATLGVPR